MGVDVSPGSRVISAEVTASRNNAALAARDGKIRELFKKLTRDCEVTFFTLKDDVGNKTYVRSAS